MSIQVQPDELADALRVYRSAYLVTVGADAHAHVIAVTPKLEGSTLIVPGLGKRSRENLATNHAVTLVWPPLEAGGHSLIVDGLAQGPLSRSDPPAEMPDDRSSDGPVPIRVIVSRAVLHRPAAAPSTAEPDECGADCIDIPADRPGAGDR